MNPGRELDALVAEKVMGCKVDRRVIGGSTEDDFHCGCPRKTHETKEEYSELEHYSTDIAAAWEVVEKIKSSEFNWSIGGGFYDKSMEPAIPTELSLDLNYSRGECEVRFMDMHNNTFCMATADTIPHAICLAALEAVGEK